jgi:uncharacterized protein
LQANYRSLKTLKLYSIPFKGLKLGKHQFDYEITDSFFDEFEYSLVKKGNLNCKVDLDKQETMMILEFKIDGLVGRSCDRCLSDFPETVNIQERQIVKFGEPEPEEANDDDIIFLPRNDIELDLSALIYEYINLAMPLTSICADEGNTPYCDQEMLDKLKAFSASEEDKENTDPDPRWNALKNIK